MPDSVPNYLSSTASGDVLAIFPGGVQIEAGNDFTPPTDRRIQWVKDDGSGALVADLSAVDDQSSGVNELKMRAETNPLIDNPPFGHDVGVTLESESLSHISHLNVLAFDSGGTSNVSATVDSEIRTIIDALGRSNFLQSADFGKFAIDWGSATATFPGGSGATTPLAVAHGLGRIPAIGIAICGSFLGHVAVQFVGRTTTTATFTVTATVNPPAGAPVLFYWLVIG